VRAHARTDVNDVRVSAANDRNVATRVSRGFRRKTVGSLKRSQHTWHGTRAVRFSSGRISPSQRVKRRVVVRSPRVRRPYRSAERPLSTVGYDNVSCRTCPTETNGIPFRTRSPGVIVRRSDVNVYICYTKRNGTPFQCREPTVPRAEAQTRELSMYRDFYNRVSCK